MNRRAQRHAFLDASFAGLILSASVYAAAGGGDIRFNLKDADPVVFSHDLHTKSKGVKCMACHFHALEQTGNSFRIRQEKLNKREFCRLCHNGLRSFDAESTRNCARCHKK